MNAGHKTRTGLAHALFALALALATVLMIAAPALADAPTDTEACFLSKINAARASTGAQPLSRDATVAGYARIHSQAMASNGGIYHSSTGDLAPYLPSDWMMWGENVGVGGTCAVLFDAFMASPDHKENLLNPKFQYAGIGDFIDANGTLWTTHVFLQRQTTSTTQPPTTTAPPTTTTTAAATTTTAAPPSTTTTATPTTTTAPLSTTTTSQAVTTTTTAAATTTTAPPTTTSAAAPIATTAPPTTTEPASTTAAPVTTSSDAAATVTTSTTTAASLAGPSGAGSLTAAIRKWQSSGILCNDAGCGGDQVLLAFIGAVLLSGSVITTWALRA